MLQNTLRRSGRVRKLTAKAMANEATKVSKSTKVAKMAPKASKGQVKAEPPVSASGPSLKRRAAASKGEGAEPASGASKKRKADIKAEEQEEEPEDAAPPAKKSRVVKTPAAPKKPKPSTPKKAKLSAAINEVPTQRLDVFVFGEGSAGELGLGSVKVDGKKPIDVKRPRLNENLSANTVGVVQIAVGGMHSAALAHDNKILTWGVNDSGALGRDTTWSGGFHDVDDTSDSDSDDDDTKMNPMESTPMAVDSKHFPEGTTFVQLAASDNATFALTTDGLVYGWGTFRSNDGILGFTEKIKVQNTPIRLPELKKITSIATGSNHVLALDHKGNVFAWGNGQQNQLGRRVVERTRLGGLVPREFGLPKQQINYISCGSYHSFAIAEDGKVFAWGLNNFGETGISEGAGEDNAVIFKPTVVKELSKYQIKEVKGGGHHSIACTTDGKTLVWGRTDGSQTGIKISDLPKEDFVYDERGAARILKKPTVVPGINAVTVCAGHDNCFAINNEGKAYSWGFSSNYQTGQGTDDDVEVATMIDNTAVRGERLTGAGAGGQFGVLWAVHE